MMKRYKKTLLLSSAVILLPTLVGLILWNRLPSQMPTHWGFDGTVDGWSGKVFAVFGMPLILLAVHWLCVWGTSLDSGNRGQNRKVSGLVLWIIPVLSWFTSGIMYAAALNLDVNFVTVTLLLMGTMFVVIGNYLPKCKQNHTIGIRIPWTLNDEENWNATHRVGGRIWVAGGAVLLAGCALPEKGAIALMLAVIPVLVAVPLVYSYVYYRKQLRAGHTPTVSGEKNPLSRKAKIGSTVGLAVVLVLVAVLMFTGDIEVRCGEDSFTVEADYYQDLTVEYDAVDSIEYRETDKAGVRTFGFGSARLMMGQFKNDAFGTHTRYSYTQCDACVVVTAGEKILVLSGKDADSTRAIYEELSGRI
jgi:uncharacterized membrane protein